MSLRTLRRRFKDPPALHAPWLGWAWNGALDDARLEQQIDAVVKAGFGGVAVYPYDGLLHGIHSSPAWFEHVAAIAKRVRRTTVSIHLRESLEGPFAAIEDSLCHDHPEVCLTELTMEALDASVPFGSEEVLAAFEVIENTPASGHRIAAVGGLTEPSGIRRMESGAADVQGSVLAFRTRTIPNRLNYLDRRAAELFLQTVPQHLATHAKRVLGRAVTGLFIDGIGLRLTPGALPWDAEIETLFKETRGYSLIEVLPTLFYNLPGFERVRYDYWTIINDMLREGLATPVKEWCQEHKLRFGVSLRPLDRRDPALLENALLPVERMSDDFVLRIPYDVAQRGFENPAAFGEWLVAIKRICSYCEQHGAPMQSAVSIGCEAPVLDLTRAAALGQWLLLHGAQTVIFERLCYRPDRCADDFCLNDEEAYWPALNSLNATLARVSGLMRQGNRRTDIAVLYPSASVQALYAHPLHAAEESRAESTDTLILKHLARLTVALTEADIDFHFVQERTLLEIGFADRRLMAVGEQRYRMLIVPPGVNLRGETIDLLDDYVSGGGALAFAGAVPYLVDGLPSEKLERIVQNYGLLLPSRSDLNDYRPIIDYMQARKIVPKRDAESLPKPRVCRRSAEEAELYLAFNDRNETRELAFDATSPFDGHVERWDARTGEMVGVAPCAKDEPVAIVDTWRPYEARMYVAVETAFRESSDATATERVAGPTPLWTVSRTSPNALEFSHCSLSDDDSRTLDETRALLADAIADAGRPVVWRTHWTFEFEPATKSTASCSLLIPDVNMEDPDRTVCLDGEPLEEADRRFYRGRPYRAYALPDPASGEHEITWQSFIGVASEFQSPVVMGEIAVRSPGSEVPAIAPAGKKLDFGLWSDFGLWCYGGPVVYRGTCTVLELPKTERVILEVPELSGVAHVKVNANAAGGLVFQPRTLDVTRFVKRGENVIEIAVAPPPGACGGAFGLAIAPVLHVERRRESE